MGKVKTVYQTPEQLYASGERLVQDLLKSELDATLRKGGEPTGDDEPPPSAEGSASTPSADQETSPGEGPGEVPSDDMPPGGDGDGDEGAGQGGTVEEYVQHLSQLPPEELDAIEQAIQQIKGGGDMGGGGGPGGPPPGGPPPAMKAEVTRLGVELRKSQQETAELRQAIARMQAAQPVTRKGYTAETAPRRPLAKAEEPRRVTLTAAQVAQQIVRGQQKLMKSQKYTPEMAKAVSTYYSTPAAARRIEGAIAQLLEEGAE